MERDSGTAGQQLPRVCNSLKAPGFGVLRALFAVRPPVTLCRETNLASCDFIDCIDSGSYK